jgi:hypothetical protein
VLASCHLHQPRCPVATKEQGVGPLEESNLQVPRGMQGTRCCTLSIR